MQAGARYRLVVRRGPQPNQQYELTRDKVTIGRDITNDVVVSDPEVSRHHARLVRTATGYAIEDLRSTNGTFVNQQRIATPHPLQNNDLIGLGETVVLAFEAMGIAEDATMLGGASQQQPPPPQQRAPYTPPPAQQPAYDQYMYEEEEEPEPDRNRLLIIGCAALTLVFCCALVAGAIWIDYANLYCDVPVIQNISFFCVP
jgi:hypothetical protein